uniref:Non-haem dioxygenase N-terminal domain-containing protein n=1 Tax=Streptomyces avermitilis TaxID=33903 RepID=A0A499VH02_STRAX|nr:hypothetical protein SAVMC3_55010 [Streptomyces avermitilis]
MSDARTPRIPTVDLRPWLSGDPDARARIARTVDDALRTAGFLLVTGHGVDPSLRTRIRVAARAFFTLPAETKQRYAARVGGRGWLGPGAEANGYSEGTETPPDLKESLTFATHEPFEDPETNAEWYAPNVWPAEAPELREPCEEYLAEMAGLEDRLLTLLGEALGLEPDFFTKHMTHPTYGFNINWYPGTEVTGDPAPASSASARTPTSARSRSSTARPARAVSRCTRTTAAGRTRPSTRRRSPSTSAI